MMTSDDAASYYDRIMGATLEQSSLFPCGVLLIAEDVGCFREFKRPGNEDSVSQ